MVDIYLEEESIGLVDEVGGCVEYIVEILLQDGANIAPDCLCGKYSWRCTDPTVNWKI